MTVPFFPAALSAFIVACFLDDGKSDRDDTQF
jgi:hypothetical protein